MASLLVAHKFAMNPTCPMDRNGEGLFIHLSCSRVNQNCSVAHGRAVRQTTNSMSVRIELDLLLTLALRGCRKNYLLCLTGGPLRSTTVGISRGLRFWLSLECYRN